MRMLKKIILFPVYVLVVIMSTSVKILIKAECWVAGVGFLLLAIFAILAIMKQQWLQVMIFVGMAGAGVLFLLLSANIQLVIETMLERLR